MPELPEVETSRLGIKPYLHNQTIKTLVIRQPKLRWTVSQDILLAQGQKILDVQRRAKYLLLQLEFGWIIIHLGMSGSLRILLEETPAQKHDHIDLILENGTTLRYTDPRRFGAWIWAPSLDDATQLKHLGPEPLSDEFNLDYALPKILKRHIPIKKLIMENAFVVGVGNIYASESLFMAKIDPNRAASHLSEEELERLIQAIKTILSQAIKQGGTTLKDFLQSDGKPGYFAQKLQVYGRAGQPCLQCGELISSTTIGQRNTFYCRYCQR